MPPQWGPNYEYIRTSTATVPILPSACNLSKSLLHLSALDHLFVRLSSPPPTLYSLDKLIEKEECKSEMRVAKYLSKALKGVEIGNKDTPFKILVSYALVLLPDVLPVKKPRIPDITVRNETGTTFFACEVDSNKSCATTTLKLSIHLAQMLASLQNRCPKTNRLEGFYFPYEKEECVLLVSVEWSKLRHIHQFSSVTFLPLSIESMLKIETFGRINGMIKNVYSSLTH